MTITDKQVEAALEAANRFALRSEYPTTAEDCMRAALEAAGHVAVDAAQAVAPYGWAIEDCNGAHHKFYPRRDYAINSMCVIEGHSPADSWQVEHADREYSGVAPHRLLALYATPPPPADDARDTDLTKLRAFANAVIDALQDVDEVVQELAVQHDLLSVTVVSSTCGDECACSEVGFPTECYSKTAALKPLADHAMGAQGGG
jgi:hypothetical protein